MPILIDMGMEKMEATLTFQEFSRNLITQFGLTEGVDVPITVRSVQIQWARSRRGSLPICAG